MSQSIEVKCDRCDKVIFERGAKAMVDKVKVDGVAYRARFVVDQVGVNGVTDLCEACLLIIAGAVKEAM